MNKNYYQIQTSQEVKALSLKELDLLADSLRQDIIQHTAVNGGHIAPSLGCVDVIVAMHRVFNTPDDSFVFDVGHQAYAHKMLTGRRMKFYQLRKENGISGFTKPAESDHDAFVSGHASNSISAALGILEGKKQLKDNAHVVVVIGDGCLTGGMSFEALNHAGDLKKNLIVILNDNQMSIDHNVGALKDALSGYHAKRYFESLGIHYWGPYDGHDIFGMVRVFEKAKKSNQPVLIHVKTKKGKGYRPAEIDPINFHGCGPFEVDTGRAIKSPNAQKKYQDLFAQTLIELASQDEKVVAITAAMPTGTSLSQFKKVHPQKFYDVGIAESHAVTFAAGLATQGIKPFVCIYSSFMQRAYDQLIHDVATQNLPVKICMDRGGVVGDDGMTHQGVFDYAFLRSIPHFVVMAPKDEVDLQRMMETARVYDEGPVSIRFPRGEVAGLPLPDKISPLSIGKAKHLYGDVQGDVVIFAIGTSVNEALKAAQNLESEEGVSVSVIDLRFAKPLDENMIVDFAKRFKVVLTVEEGVVIGGVGSGVLECLAKNNVSVPCVCLGIADEFIHHATQKRQREMCGINASAIYKKAIELYDKTATSQSDRTGQVIELRSVIGKI